MSETRELLRSLYRRPKAELVELVELWAEEHRRSWVIGGPRHWSKEMLVSAVMRIRRGEEP